jgi:hypothetical protein
MNGLAHVLRAHQLCMEGFTTMFDGRLSTVWSAPNYCYRAGNQASILEVGPGQSMFFNVFNDAPENEHDGPVQHAQQTAAGQVRTSVSVNMRPFLTALEAAGILSVKEYKQPGSCGAEFSETM